MHNFEDRLDVYNNVSLSPENKIKNRNRDCDGIEKRKFGNWSACWESLFLR